MNTYSDKKDNSRFTRITVILPIFISVLSLGFGVYEYFDKRELERKLAELENKADIYIQYLETDLESIHTYVHHGSSFDKACLQWLHHLEMTPVFGIKLEMLENPIYREIKEYKESISDHYVTFFLINNTGGNKATKISAVFDKVTNGHREDCQVELDQLEPGKGVMFLIDHFNITTRKYYGSRLVPKDYQLKYFDVFLEGWQNIKIRSKLQSPRIVAPKVRLLR